MSQRLSVEEVDAAEGDLASLRVHIARLPAGLVRTRVEATLAAVERELQVAAPSTSSEAWRRVQGELSTKPGLKPKSPAENLSLAVHALLCTRFRCVGTPPASTTGFAAAERELERGSTLPDGWNDRGATGACAAFRYRPIENGSSLPLETYEMTCSSAPPSLQISIATTKRGVLHADELEVAHYAETATDLKNLEELAAYVERVVASRLAVAPPAAARVDPHARARPPQQPGFAPPSFGVPGFAPPSFGVPPGPLAPNRPSNAPFFDDGGMLVGPDQFGVPGPRHLGQPRFDPIAPGGGFNDPTDPLRDPRQRNRMPRFPGEPNSDHLRPPGYGNDDDMFS